MHRGVVRSYAKELKCILDIWFQNPEEEAERKIFAPFNPNITDHAENKSQTYDYCKNCCITKRLVI